MICDSSLLTEGLFLQLALNKNNKLPPLLSKQHLWLIFKNQTSHMRPRFVSGFLFSPLCLTLEGYRIHYKHCAGTSCLVQLPPSMFSIKSRPGVDPLEGKAEPPVGWGCSATLPEEARTSCSDSSWSRPWPRDPGHLRRLMQHHNFGKMGFLV